MMLKNVFPVTLLGLSALMTGCGGGGSGTPVAPTTLSGTAAAGAPIIDRKSVV